MRRSGRLTGKNPAYGEIDGDLGDESERPAVRYAEWSEASELDDLLAGASAI